jgi:hypothetical protein
MRRLASFLLLGIALAASAKDIWRWKDADGVVHYSDSPVQGAERINASPAPKPGSVSTAAPPGNPGREQEASNAVRYTRCEVIRPAKDTTFNSAVESVSADVTIEPPLQPNHRIQVYLNGSIYPQWPDNSVSFTFPQLDRGAYTLSVRVQDENGGTACSGPAINFYVRQPSVLSPARQPQKKN